MKLLRYIGLLVVYLGATTLPAQILIQPPNQSFGGSDVRNLRVLKQSEDGSEVTFAVDFNFDGIGGASARLLPLIIDKKQPKVSSWFGADPVTISPGHGTISLKVKFFNDEPGVPKELTTDRVRILMLSDNGNSVISQNNFSRTIKWGNANAPETAPAMDAKAQAQVAADEKRVEEEKAQIERETKARQEARLKAEQDRLAAEAKAKAREEARIKAEQDRLAAEAKAEAEADAKAREEARVKAEQEKLAAEAQAKADAEAKALEEARLKAEQERLAAEAKAKALEQARLQAEQERLAAEARAKAEAEAKAQEAARIQAEQERLAAVAQAKADAEAKAREEARIKAEQERLAAEAKAKSEAEAKALEQARIKAEQERLAALAQAKTDAEAKALEQARIKAEQERLAAEAKAKADAEAKAREEARIKAEQDRLAAEAKAKAEAEAKAREEARIKAERDRLAAEAKAKAEAEAKAREEAHIKAEQVRLAADAKAKAEAEAKAREEARIKAEQERLAAEAKAKADAEAKAREEARIKAEQDRVAAVAAAEAQRKADLAKSAHAPRKGVFALATNTRTKVTNVDVVNRNIDRTQMTIGVEYQFSKADGKPRMGVDFASTDEPSATDYFVSPVADLGRSSRNFVMFEVKLRPEATAAFHQATLPTDKIWVYLTDDSGEKTYIFQGTMILLWHLPGAKAAPVAVATPRNTLQLESFKQNDLFSGYVTVKYNILAEHGRLRLRIYDSANPGTADWFFSDDVSVKSGPGMQLVRVAVPPEAKSPDVFKADTIELLLLDQKGQTLADLKTATEMSWAKPK
jgi:membrane protein involved in colicin uptake